MCTYLTEKLAVEGSGKGAAGWFGLTEATVYFDHPQHARAEHTLNIDFLNPGQGPSARVAVELTAESARALAAAIESALAAVPPGLACGRPGDSLPADRTSRPSNPRPSVRGIPEKRCRSAPKMPA